MLAGRFKCPPIFYIAVIAVAVALICLGAWSRYHKQVAPATVPLHDQR
ncbi:MAG TPA: hypothetical protein VMT53_25070 [Terriglobales bacterium]|nr:hypothetical protein [Terriglobales bacterium]